MTDLTRHRSSYNPWLIGYPFLPPVRLQNAPPRPAARGGSWLLALRCRLRRTSIDRALAAGAEPHSSECRHRRAAQLTGQSNRRALSAAYERLLAGVAGPEPYGVAPVNWDGVRAAKPRIEHLAKRLREDPRARAQGVALAWLLLTERDSALYGKNDVSDVVGGVRSALALL